MPSAEYQRQWRLRNPGKQAGYAKKYREANRQACLEKLRVWQKRNRVRIRKYHNKYLLSRRNQDPQFRLLTNLRSRMYQALRNNRKKSRTTELLGLSLGDFRKYLESLFK